MFATMSTPYKSGFFSREYQYIFLVALTTKISSLIKEVFLSNIKIRTTFNKSTPCSELIRRNLFPSSWTNFSCKPSFQHISSSTILGPCCKLKSFPADFVVRREMYHVVSMIVGTTTPMDSMNDPTWPEPLVGSDQSNLKTHRSFSFPLESFFRHRSSEDANFASDTRVISSTVNIPSHFVKNHKAFQKENSPQKRMSDSICSESSDDFIVFESSFVSDCTSETESETDSETSEDSSDEESSSSTDDEDGWTSDCEQLCISLMQHASPAACKPNASFAKKIEPSVDVVESSDENFVPGNINESFPCQKQLSAKSALEKLCWVGDNDSIDSGTGSLSSNPSDSSTGDEDPAIKDSQPGKYNPNTSSSSLSSNPRKFPRPTSCPSLFSRSFTLSILSLDATSWHGDALGPESPVYHVSDPSNESDWESDTESEDIETHYPSRTTKSKVKAAANAKLSDECSLSSMVKCDTVGGFPLQICRCSSQTILKCSFCIELRKTKSRVSHERTVWFPESTQLETTHVLPESDDECDEADEFQIYYCYSPFSCQQQQQSFNQSPSNSPSSLPSRHRSSRRSPWEMFARDRHRFQRRIAQRSKQISPILSPEHRLRVYNSRFKDFTPSL